MKLDLTNCCCLRLFCHCTDFVQVQCLLKQVANGKTHVMIELNFVFIYLFLLHDDRLVKVNFDFLFPKSFFTNILQKVTQLILPKCRELRNLQSDKICLQHAQNLKFVSQVLFLHESTNQETGVLEHIHTDRQTDIHTHTHTFISQHH